MKYAIRVNEVKNQEGNLRGFATVVLGDSFKINNIAILENHEGALFVAMPRFRSNEKDEKGQNVYKDVCHPITKEFRQELYDGILDTFAHVKEQPEQPVKSQVEAEPPEFKVSVTPYEKDGSNIRGLARVYFDDSFVLGNVSLIQGKENVFVAMPSYKTKQVDEQGKAIYQDVAYPVTKEFREKLYGEVMKVYEQEKEKRHSEAQQGNPQQSQQAEKDREGQFQSVTERDTPFR